MNRRVSMLLTVAAMALSKSVAAEDQTPSGTLEEVVVTAQKRSESLQNVPLSVTAFNASQLTDAGVTTLRDLGQVVPTLSIGNAVGFSFVYLRGVGSTGIGPGIELPVSFYLDGVYYASTVSPTFYDFANIDHIEVLKGPQGTLFGRNATGGLIQIITKDPTQQFHAAGELTYGNYETVSAKQYVSGGITDNLAADVSINAGTQGQGWGRNVYNGTDVNKNYHNITVRSKWVFTPTDSDKITFIGDYSNADNSMNGEKLAPGTVSAPLGGVQPAPQPAQGPWDMDTDTNPRFHNWNAGASLKIEHQFDSFSVTSLSAYRDSASTLIWDVDFTPIPNLAGDLIDLENQLSEELTFSSKAGEKLTWTAGLYVFHADGSYDPAGVYSGDGLFGPFTYVAPYARQVTESEAGYAQATYEVADATNLTAGVRYTHENRDISGFENGYLAGSTVPVSLSTTAPASLQFNKPTYRLALDHHFTPEVMSYVSFNTGFKSGGFNTQFASQPAFLPESVKAYEIGMKDDLLDRRLRLNVAAFDYEYRNIQVQKVGIANTGIINGAAARIYGLDGDFEALLSDNFRINGSLAYLHARFLDFSNAPFGSPGGGVPTYAGDASGNDIPKSPHYTVNLTPDYRIPLPGGPSLHLNGTAEYNSGYFFEPDNELKQHSFVRINASVRWDSTDERYYARLFVDNLTNRAIISYSSTLADGSRNVSYEAPRLYGISVGYKF